jgi:anti-anti-sigma factor
MDSSAFETLEGEFGKLLAAGVKSVILESSGLEDMTSAGLGAIVNMARALEANGGVLVLTLLRPGVEGLLDMLGVKESLTLADNLEAARKIACGKQ